MKQTIATGDCEVTDRGLLVKQLPKHCSGII